MSQSWILHGGPLISLWVFTIEMSARRAWNAETAITGGLVGDNLVTILWNKIAALTGGTTEWPFGLGLRPWYLQVTLTLPTVCHTGTPHSVAAFLMQNRGQSCERCPPEDFVHVM